ncbi:MAG: nucleotidyltransferase domain-containing protein [Kiritimatiellae bacterium]|nr:nucleotidyltransferase domain-containing protein [Kiritimatiellia bacterium]
MKKQDKKRLQAQLLPVFSKYHKELVVAYLFGSMANGTESPSSDIDIAVLLRNRDKKSTVTLRLHLHADLCRALGRNDIDLVVLNLSGNLILNDQIARHGFVLYSTDDTDDEKTDFELKVIHRCTDFKLQRYQVMGV